MGVSEGLPTSRKNDENLRRNVWKNPTVEVIHAGLECGILSTKIPNLDCVSIGPNIYEIHTTEEHMSISSVQRMWNYLVEIVKTK